MVKDINQLELFETFETRSLLDKLFEDSKLYTKSKDYKNLLDFVVRLRNFAPFNAMLLQVQKPGLSYAASARDWRERFGRRPKDGARPLLILWPFGPVALVYDVNDTEGKELPQDVASFFAQGDIDVNMIASFIKLLANNNIKCNLIDAGDNKAGLIRSGRIIVKGKEVIDYQISINRNHSPAVQFSTLAHELGHLFLGHLGPDLKLKVPKSRGANLNQNELEAESLAYVVCKRNGVTPKSEKYLSDYISDEMKVEHIDIYQIMRAAGQVENFLGLTAHTKYDRPE